jgi:hypothetical protein
MLSYYVSQELYCLTKPIEYHGSCHPPLQGPDRYPRKSPEKFSLKEGDPLVLVEENDAIRLQPLGNLSELWGVDTLEDTGAMLKEVREEWDDDLEKKAAL